MDFIVVHDRHASDLACHVYYEVQANIEHAGRFIRLAKSHDFHKQIVSYCEFHAFSNLSKLSSKHNIFFQKNLLYIFN